MPLHFLIDDASSAFAGDLVTLTGAEAHHAAVVRRVRVDEQVTAGDGHGVWLVGSVVSVAPREVIVRVTSRTEVAAQHPRLVLVQALAKGDRDERAVEAATEIGVDEIVPWQAARSISRWDAAKAEKGRQRWATIAREAAKQAHRAWVPGVVGVETTADLVRRAETSLILVLEPTAAGALTALDLHGERDILLVVGPEGGIASEELEALVAAGAIPVRLGDTVLRTSTAGPSALAVASVRLGRW